MPGDGEDKPGGGDDSTGSDGESGEGGGSGTGGESGEGGGSGTGGESGDGSGTDIETTSPINGVIYKINKETNTATLLNVDGNASSVTINDSKQIVIDEDLYTITGVDENAFENVSGCTKVTFPASMCSEMNAAIKNSMQALDITITGSGTISGFAENKKINSVSLGEGITTIAAGAFAGCSPLNFLVLNNGVTVEEQAFANCTLLVQLVLPAQITIKDNAFSGCRAESIMYVYVGTEDEWTELRESSPNVFGTNQGLPESPTYYVSR